MEQRSEIPASEAARRLGVHDSRIRRLAASGELPARKVANRWLIDARSMERRESIRRGGGRPLEPANAWGLLFLASGELAPWLPSDARSRLRRRLRQGSLQRDLVRLHKRARPSYFVGGARARMEVSRNPSFVRSGLSAATAYGARVRSPNIVEGYLPAAELRRLAYRLALRPAEEREADLILHAVSAFWPFADRKLAPVAVVAADLLGSLDQRTKRAGQELLRRV